MALALMSFDIVGIKPLLQANPTKVMKWDPKSGRTKQTDERVPPYDEAQRLLYEDDDGQLYHPAIAFWWSMQQGAEARKIGGKSVRTVIVQFTSNADENFILLDPATLDKREPRQLSKTDWLPDIRSAVNRNSKPPARILVARPKFRSWGGIFTLEVDMDYFQMEADKVASIFAECLCRGGQFGVGAGRTRYEQKGKGGEWKTLHMGKYRASVRSVTMQEMTVGESTLPGTTDRPARKRRPAKRHPDE